MAAIDLVNRLLREFTRYTGDGKPGAPLNAPLPVGDPSSAAWSPKKAELRAAMIAVLDDAGASVAEVQEIISDFGDLNAALALSDANAATTSADVLLSSEIKAAAQLAASAALAAANVKPDIATGRNSVTDGNLFAVVGSGDVAAIIYKRLTSTTQQDTGISIPSAAAVSRAAITAWLANRWKFVGDGNPALLPVTVTAGLKVLTTARRDGLVNDPARMLLDTWLSNRWKFIGDGNPLLVPVDVSADLKVLSSKDIVTNQMSGAGATVTTPPEGMAYISAGKLRIVGGGAVGTGSGDRQLNGDANKTWLACQSFFGSVFGVYEMGGKRYLARVSVSTGRLWHDGEISIITGEGQSLAEGEAGTSALALHPQYSNPDRVRQPRPNGYLAMVTAGGTSVALDPNTITGFMPLGDVIGSVGNGTLAVTTAADAYARRAARDCGGWVPLVLAWTNSEGGQTIARLSKNPDDPATYHAWANYLAAMTKIAALAAIEGRHVVHRWMTMDQGASDENDVNLGSKHAAFVAQANIDIPPITGQEVPIRMISSQRSAFFNTSNGSRSILAYAMANETAYGNYHCLGPSYEFPWSSDLHHHTSLGYDRKGQLFEVAIDSIERTGFWRTLRMVSASITGANQITVALSEAAVSQTDYLYVAAIADLGIVVPGKTIASVVVVGASIVINTTGAAAGATVVQAGMTGHVLNEGGPLDGRTTATIPRTNIRSAVSYGKYRDDNSDIRKWLGHQEIAIS